jgi:acylphosphatase
MRTVRIMVSGRVQGVGYRWWTVGQAKALGLRGWVRNRRDGSVEILASGDGEAVQRLAELCSDGPSAARVTNVAVEESGEGAPEGFEERATV